VPGYCIAQYLARRSDPRPANLVLLATRPLAYQQQTARLPLIVETAGDVLVLAQHAARAGVVNIERWLLLDSSQLGLAA
jgi:hypothetical protein